MEDGVTIIDPQTIYIDGDAVICQDTVIKPNTFIEGRVSIGSGCVLGPNSVVVDSKIADNVTIRYSYVDGAEIENNVKIGPFAHIRPGTILKEKVKVGNFSEIKKSVIDENSKVNHLSYIGDAVVGKNVNIGAGTITCNYDGKNKHQTILEDEVFVGSNVNLVAPVTIKKRVVIGAGSTITKNVEPGKLAIARARQIVINRKKRI
jgi:bifunctional UDP-N-acetylglucosamine pyrophosphorylase/glucosamine-1-phosphate N-acetyltransferase